MKNLIVISFFIYYLLCLNFGSINSKKSITFEELTLKFQEYSLKKDKLKELENNKILNEDLCNNSWDSVSRSGSVPLNLEFDILNVPLVHNGIINLMCDCKYMDSEGVNNGNFRFIKGLNCTSTNNLINVFPDFDDDDDLSMFEDDKKLIESFKDIYKNRRLGLEIVLTLNNQPEDFCRLSLLGFKDELNAFPKLDYEHFSLLEIGMAFCFYLGKLNNYFFDHPSPVTEILEGELFETDEYINNEVSFDSFYEENDIEEWEYSNYKKSEESGDLGNKIKVNGIRDKLNFILNPFLRISYIPKKPYPRIFIKSNVPYTKSIYGLDRSVPKNYYSVAGKWQISITPGYTIVDDNNSILSLLGSKFNSINKENDVLNKLKGIASKWRNLTFSPNNEEFLGCQVGKKMLIPKISKQFKVTDPTSLLKKFPENLQMETVFEIMNSNIDFNSLKDQERNSCAYFGNIRNCLKLIRTRIRDKSINYILGNLFINIIYELWITWGSDVWYMVSLTNIENLFQDSINSKYNKDNENDYVTSSLTRLFNIEPLIDDKKQDIISLLKENLFDNNPITSLKKDIFQFGVLSIDPLLIDNYWDIFSKNHCKISSDAAFITWICNKYTFSLYNNENILEKESDLNNEIEEKIENFKNNTSWILEPLPNYFDKIDPEIEVELFSDEKTAQINLPEFFEYEDLVDIYSKNEFGDEKINSKNRKNFFNSNYFSEENEKKWVSFVVKNVPYRDSKKKNLEFKCSKGSWPYKGGDISWMGNYMCEVVFISSGFSFNFFDFSTYNDYYENEKNDNLPKIPYFRRLNRNRMIGIEFETSYPHRCGIGYLGNESKKTLTDVKGSKLLKISLGFCLMNGFKLQWLSDDSFNIYTEILYKYTQSLENGLTYYERNGFELSGFVQQKIYSINTCSGISISHNSIKNENSNHTLLNNNKNLTSNYSFLHRTVNCQVSYDPIVVTDGIRIQELKYMRDKYINLLYNMKFECKDIKSNNMHSSNINNHCINFYPLLEKVRKNSKIICKFEETKEWKIINKEFPDVCKIGGRIGSCHRELRKKKICNKENKNNCNLDLFITDNFIKPINIEIIKTHLNNISLLLMNGIKKFTQGWDPESIFVIKNLLSNLVLEKEFDLYYNNGINGIFEERISLFIKELSSFKNNILLNNIKDLLSSSGIWIDTHSLPILWRLAMFRIEDIPLFKNKNLSSTFFGNKLLGKTFRSNLNNRLEVNEKINTKESKYFINTPIPLYCPQAIGYFWIDKYMWQMYRYPESDLQNTNPID